MTDTVGYKLMNTRCCAPDSGNRDVFQKDRALLHKFNGYNWQRRHPLNQNQIPVSLNALSTWQVIATFVVGSKMALSTRVREFGNRKPVLL